MNSISDVINELNSKGYIVYTEPGRLNVVGIRSSNPVSETFDDQIAYFYFDDNGTAIGNICPATTDPSVYFLENPINSTGTAILKSGQYVDCYKIGLHKGKYECLVQSAPVTVIRDTDRDKMINFFSKTETGMYGIEVHRASSGKGDGSSIGLDSAGCQVFQNESDFNQMMSIAKNSADLYGNSFTYTLIDNHDAEVKSANTSAVVIGVSLIVIGWIGFVKYMSNK